MKTIGFGIIGCGWISNAHLIALSKRSDARVVCVADINPEAAQRQAEKYNAGRWVTDSEELLAMPEVDAVVVCTPTHIHAHDVCAAAAMGKHILCEKPIAITLEQTDRMIAACERSGSLLMVAFVRRFCSEWLKFREIIREGLLGRPVVWRATHASSGPRNPWFRDIDQGGGPFIDAYVHDYDFARFTFGEAEQVIASLRNLKANGTAPDTGTAIIKFSSGDEIVRAHSWGLPDPACRPRPIQDIIGPKGALRFPSVPASGSTVNYFYLMDGQSEEYPIEYLYTTSPEWFSAQMDHFITCIREGCPPCITGEDGRKALEIGLAVVEAGTTSLPVSIRQPCKV